MKTHEIVERMLANRNSKEWLVDRIDPQETPLHDLTQALDGVFRSRWQTRDLEKATAFTVLCKAIVSKSQTPEFPDPKNGMVRKKIKDINLFVTEYSDSIYSFVKHIEVTNG